MKSQSAPQIRQFAGFWTLLNQPSQGNQWSIEEKILQAKQAGFDAMGGSAAAATAEAVHRAGMDYICYIDANDKTFEDRLEAAATTKPARINVQLWDHDTRPEVAVKTWTKMLPIAKKLGLEIDLEVHRDTCTETPEKTYRIAELYEKATGKQCRFCFDFSHIAVVKHLNPPYSARLLEHPELVQGARQMHFRPFNGHHCQIPATDGEGRQTVEFKDYLQFVNDLLICWFEGVKGGEVLYVCPEFGPKIGYGLTTFPNVWRDAILLRGEVQKLWRKTLTKWKQA